MVIRPVTLSFTKSESQTVAKAIHNYERSWIAEYDKELPILKLFFGINRLDNVEFTREQCETLISILDRSSRTDGSEFAKIREQIKTAMNTPYVGMPATMSVGSDRYPYEVVEVSKSGKLIYIKPVQYYRTDKNGLSESQSYVFGDVVATATPTRVTLRKNGRWVCSGSNRRSGSRISLGQFDAYYDPSF